jgi:hypothetical protein
MYLYKISQNVNNGYHSYSDAIVCAESEKAAKNIRPGEHTSDWCRPSDVTAELIGIAAPQVPRGVVACWRQML